MQLPRQVGTGGTPVSAMAAMEDASSQDGTTIEPSRKPAVTKVHLMSSSRPIIEYLGGSHGL
jgi:hypothetical protein